MEFQAGLQEDTKHYDAQFLVDHFELQKSMDECFFYAIEKDGEGHLKYYFWSDAISRQDFYLFEEAVTFDTTYHTSYYKLVFAMFCKVNHHQKTVMFAGAFISNEGTSAFIWLFERFIECMGCGPPVIIID